MATQVSSFHENACGSTRTRPASLAASADWQTWLDGAGAQAGAVAHCADIDASGGLRFDTVQLALEAAAGGLGVAIGRLPLADADLAAHTLVAASSHIGTIMTIDNGSIRLSYCADSTRKTRNSAIGKTYNDELPAMISW